MFRHEGAKPKIVAISPDEFLFRLRDLECIKGDGNWRIGQQLAASHALFVVEKGRGRLMLGKDEYRLHQGAVYICPPGGTYGAEADDPGELKIFLFKFDVFRATDQGCERVQNMEREDSFPLKGAITPDDQLVSLCEEVFRHWHSRDGLERFRSQLIFQELLYRAMKSRSLRSGESQTALEAAKNYMERYFNENLTIEQLARIAKISPKYFVDLFKKTYGISAIDYLTELRLNKAKELMAQPNARLRDIAHQVGYHDEFYFSRKFKKKVGIAPTVYMKRRRRKIAAYRTPVIGQLLALKMIPYAAPLHPK